MAVNWTKEQQKVIDTHDRNLLVSAAAGSGKTAVLVERIIKMISEGETPMDIDRLLVMTFTNAAASEMRERIGDAIRNKLIEDPSNLHLQEQAALVNHAQITTIDSFCLHVIQDYVNMLDIDPAFRIGDDGELMLLKTDVMEHMLEDFYDEGDEDFLQFIETYAKGKADGGIEDYIMQIYNFAQSNPWPQEWFSNCRTELEQEKAGNIDDSAWLKYIFCDIKETLSELKEMLYAAVNLCESDQAFDKYVDLLNNEYSMIDVLYKSDDFTELSEGLSKISFDRMPSVRKKDVNEADRAFITGCRDRVKKTLLKIKENYGCTDIKSAIEDMSHTGSAVSAALKLAEEFSSRYQKIKKEKKLVDFNDLEHFALQLLLTDDTHVPTVIADELSTQYDEILVDEYQDSNYVQEELIKSISRERYGTPNVFMVGDVKQSIYRFRLARPELFLEKYHSYTDDDSSYQKIELHQNFRSRKEVLESINNVFFKIMAEGLGGIEYTKDVALNEGAVFEPIDSNDTATELIMVNTRENDSDYSTHEAEAKLIAAKIKEITNPESKLKVWNKAGKCYKTADYGDIVILLRSMSNFSETFVNVLMNEGIPAYAESRTGYFNTVEVETVLSLLAVIDNPMQDIPLAAVLKSPIGGFSDIQLADMMAHYKADIDEKDNEGIYGAMKQYPEAEDFRKLLMELSGYAKWMSIHKLIYKIYEITGYYDYVSAMPAGDIRRANLDMLAQKATAYENTSYSGLFDFIRYIDKLKKYQTDFGEASVLSENGNTVRIMSVHKSKGLEFPVVILAGMAKNFNKTDTRGRIFIDPDLGIATDYIDLDRRLKTTTLKQQVLKKKMETDNLGEELRVLYVAMTRAREKLIMTAADKYIDNKTEKMMSIPVINDKIPCTTVSEAGSWLEWVLMGLIPYAGNSSVKLEEIPVAELIEAEIERQEKKSADAGDLLSINTDIVYDEKFHEHIKKISEYIYPYTADITLHTKMSVSELKEQGQFSDDEESTFLHAPSEHRQSDGAKRGTVYHRVLELLALDTIKSLEDIRNAVDKMEQSKRLEPDDTKLIDINKLWNLLNSDIGRRMTEAKKSGKLYRERQFVMGMPAREMNIAESEEPVLIQGIIDAYIEEQDGITVIDYKTDNVKDPDILIKRYKVQLDYYKHALEQMTGKKVVGEIIYSIAMDKEIHL